jgi:peptidyl-tRNA hydrolase
LDSSKAKADLERLVPEMNGALNNLKLWGHIGLVYKMEKDLKEATRYVEAVESLNTLVGGFQNTLIATRQDFKKGAAEALEQVKKDSAAASESLGKKADEVLRSVNEKLKETSEKFNATVEEATTLKEKIKAIFEASLEYWHKQGLTAFGSAFGEEAKEAEKKARIAGLAVVILIEVLLFAIALFVRIEVNGEGLKAADAVGLWRWSMLRISCLAFFAWFIGHFFRERKNFLHVAVANRHRRNLCDAYVAFAEKMSPEERAKYLGEIIPNLATLGKTGFISKEEVPDMPWSPVMNAIAGAIKK